MTGLAGRTRPVQAVQQHPLPLSAQIYRGAMGVLGPCCDVAKASEIFVIFWPDTLYTFTLFFFFLFNTINKRPSIKFQCYL